jgi:hypothetical protein
MAILIFLRKFWDSYLVQLKYLDVTVLEKLRSGWASSFVNVALCCG